MIKKKTYQLNVQEDGRFEVYNASGSLRFLSSIGVPMLPVANRASNWSAAKISTEIKNDAEVITYAMPTNALYENPCTVVTCHDDYIEVYFKGTVRQRASLDKWNLLARGSSINALEVLNYRSHINSPSAYEVNQTILARRRLGSHGCSVNTEDSDMMFAPHPMLFVLQNLEDNMVIAPMQLMQAESAHLHLESGQTTVKDYFISIGNSIYWLEPGEELESPHFMITLTTDAVGSGGNKMLKTYTDILVLEKLIEPKKTEDMAAWWFSPIWCSWGDQHTHLDSVDVVSTAFTQNMRKQAADAICPAFVDLVVERIGKHDLPVRTLLIDDRWYTHWGDMEADPKKFPDFRSYVDSLHKKGFKIMAWASIWRASQESKLYKEHPEWFLVHHYDRDHHNADDTDVVAFDFSNQKAADAFLDELLGRLLSDGPGCYNLDGIKFDWPFLIPHNYAYADRSWVGKENTTYKTQKMIYDKAKQIKKDALIIGVTPHPFFQDAHDIIRTYDVSTYDIRVHLERAAYIKALCPGMPVAMDEHVFYQNFFRYMEEGSKQGIPMMYNLLRFNGDGHAYTEADYKKLKSILDGYVASVPPLQRYMESLPTVSAGNP
jgi:hypothetical protein